VRRRSRPWPGCDRLRASHLLLPRDRPQRPRVRQFRAQGVIFAMRSQRCPRVRPSCSVHAPPDVGRGGEAHAASWSTRCSLSPGPPTMKVRSRRLHRALRRPLRPRGGDRDHGGGARLVRSSSTARTRRPRRLEGPAPRLPSSPDHAQPRRVAWLMAARERFRTCGCRDAATCARHHQPARARCAPSPPRPTRRGDRSANSSNTVALAMVAEARAGGRVLRVNSAPSYPRPGGHRRRDGRRLGARGPRQEVSASPPQRAQVSDHTEDEYFPRPRVRELLGLAAPRLLNAASTAPRHRASACRR